jgi:hypothetical protein
MGQQGHLLKTEKLTRSRKWREVRGDFPKLVYCMLVGLVDSWGMVPADPESLKLALGPRDTHTPEEYWGAALELNRVELLSIWNKQGDPWLYVVGHDAEQTRGIHRRKKKPDISRPEWVESPRRYDGVTMEQEKESSHPPPTDNRHPKRKKAANPFPDSRPNPTARIKELLIRYQQYRTDWIDECYDAIRSTRKGGQIEESIWMKILEDWNKHHPQHVLDGIKKYLDGGYCRENKRENYLLGIIRAQKGIIHDD